MLLLVLPLASLARSSQLYKAYRADSCKLLYEDMLAETAKVEAAKQLAADGATALQRADCVFCRRTASQKCSARAASFAGALRPTSASQSSAHMMMT